MVLGLVVLGAMRVVVLGSVLGAVVLGVMVLGAVPRTQTPHQACLGAGVRCKVPTDVCGLRKGQMQVAGRRASRVISVPFCLAALSKLLQ